MAKPKYSDDEIKNILEIRIKLAKNEIGYEEAKIQTLNPSKRYKIRNLKTHAKSMKEKTLKGIGECNPNSFPSNWAKILLEITQNDPLIIQALKDQQRLYLEKDGRNNKELEKLLKDIENKIRAVL